MVSLGRIYIPMLAVLVLLAFRPPGFIEEFELKIYDILIKYTSPNEPDPRIVIVGIDESSLDAFGRWPWPRSFIGEIVEKLAGYGAVVTALDMTFTTEANRLTDEAMERIGEAALAAGVDKAHPGFYRTLLAMREEMSKDDALAGSLRRAGNVVTGFLFHKGDEFTEETREEKRRQIRPFRIKLVRMTKDSRGASIEAGMTSVAPNIPVIQEVSAASGFLNAAAGPDGVFRSYPMVIEHKGDFYPSLALAAVALYGGVLNDTYVYFKHGVFSGVGLGSHFVDTDEHGMVLLRFLGPEGIFNSVSVKTLMEAPPDDEMLRGMLTGRLALVGATATEIKDVRTTPYGQTNGVEVQANAMAAAFNNLSVTKFGYQSAYDAALTLVLGLILLLVIPRVNIYIGLVFALSLFGALGWFNHWMFREKLVWLNSVIPSGTIGLGYLTITVYQFIAERKSKKFIQEAFGHYLSPKVIAKIIEDPGLLKLGGEKREMTAFFSDIAGFTSISEKLQPNELVALLNDYLSAMTDIILELDGTVDKYEGDAIIAFWGAPLDVDDHAERCVLAAVRMQRKIAAQRERWRREAKADINVRIGINTGQMVVGNMGSKDRMDYTMMGDAVNLASRLEGANKYYGSKIMISEFTRAEVADRFLLRELDRVRVAGKEEPIRVYEVIEEKDAATEEQRRFAHEFQEAVKAFQGRAFSRALAMFKSLDAAAGGEDKAVSLYLERLSRFQNEPPPEEWEGVYDLAK